MDTHHHEHDEHDELAHRDPEPLEEPLDAANQSLADALRASFSILKGIMMVLVVLYLFSNVKCIGPHQQALVLRLGRLLPEVHEAGLLWALPFPIDEVVPLATKASNTMEMRSHTFQRRPEEEGKPLSFCTRSLHEGLRPGRDGALMTGDLGLVHARWKVTYRIGDVKEYVSNLYGAGDQTAAEDLIRTMVENAAIHVASAMTAEEVIRTRVDQTQSEIKRAVNQQLRALRSGVEVSTIEVMEPTPPLQVRTFFEETQRAENTRQEAIRRAEQDRTRILNEAAGAAYPRLVALLDDPDLVRDNLEQSREVRAQLDALLTDEVEGAAGKLIKDAGAVYSEMVRRMEGDVALYRTLIPQYERNPALLVERLWEDTRAAIFAEPGVTTVYRPASTHQFRLHFGMDPEQRRLEEEERLQKKTFDPSRVGGDRLVPVGPEYD
ncbi:MAG TPA: SPFH domain-containing protein [Phycisphaerae bacterium]|nr:SPFH domain-containing protein [Phycisphaerae bacterium]HNU44665.1 SPFH domain-containing protein [Phycisphaerae bacterium]